MESFKWVPWPLDEGPRPKSGKLRLNLHGTYFGGKINWLRPKNSAKKRAPDLENQESGLGPWYSPTQGFNLLQVSPNWFLGNWTLDPPVIYLYTKNSLRGCYGLEEHDL